LLALDRQRFASHVDLLLESIVDAAGIGARHIERPQTRALTQRDTEGMNSI
jgi:hypothetical protein